ncbi:MAG: hypothetical protein ACTHJ5_09590, partial [Ilyomonas sp.]
MPLNSYFPDFFTATIPEWKLLLKQDKFKNILIQSLEYLVKDERILLYGFPFLFRNVSSKRHERKQGHCAIEAQRPVKFLLHSIPVETAMSFL